MNIRLISHEKTRQKAGCWLYAVGLWGYVSRPMSLYQTIVAATPLPIRKAVRSIFPISYNRRHARDASRLVDIKSAKILVVGANTGEDCKEFIELGAKEVHGVDVIPNVGSAFRHPRISYFCQSIEGTDLKSESYDLVFSVATMEHVHDIEAGFSEMNRLAKPRGAIYSFASPLWFSPYGHHMECFQGHPWVHLALRPDEIRDYAKHNALTVPPWAISYMTNPDFFNCRKASEYLEAAGKIPLPTKNILLTEDSAVLKHPLGRRVIDLGFSENDLLSVSHLFVRPATA